MRGPASAPPNGEMVPNEKFPDVRALADAVHARGLKLGIYSSPGPKTCEGFEGSFGHEMRDAATYARWGVDFLKYDWCSYEEIARDHSLPGAAEALPPDERCARASRPRHRLFAVPVRIRQCLGMGRTGRRPSLAQQRRPARSVVEPRERRLSPGRDASAGADRDIGTTPTCSSSAPWDGVPIFARRG